MIALYNNTMNTQKRKVAVIGGLNVDIGGIPEAAFMPGDSIPGRVAVSLGGVGFNIARSCASLGAETAFFSVLGEDANAPMIRAEAERFGVSLNGCRWENAENNRYLYISGKSGDMAAAINDMRLCERMDAGFIRDCLPLINDCDAAAVDANLPPAALKALAEGVSVPLAADCVSAVKCGRLRDILPKLCLLKANRMEAEMLTGRIEPDACAEKLLDAGVKRVVISLGADGVLCGENGKIFTLGAADSSAVVDSTGAGDSLTAALTVGLANGLALRRSAALGMRAAAITVGEVGAATKKLSVLMEEFS